MPIISYFPTSDKELLEGKQDKIEGIKGQVVGFDDKGNAVAQTAPDTGVTTFKGRTGSVTPQTGDYTAEQVGAISSTEKGTAGGVASLGTDGKVPSSQIPALDYDPIGSASAVQNNLNSHTGNTSNPHKVTAVQAGAAPTSHAVNVNTYGLGTSSLYGHVKLSDNTNDSNDATSGTAATPKAVKAAYDLANGKAAANHTHTAADVGAATSSHSHAFSAITGSVAVSQLPTVTVAKGGTGATDAATALKNLGAAESGHSHAISDLTGTAAVSQLPTITVAKGGTGQTTAAKGLYALINGSSVLTDTTIVDDDYIGLLDTSASTGKKITIKNLMSYIVNSIRWKVSINIGDTVSWCGHNWIVVHIDNGIVYLAYKTTYGSNIKFNLAVHSSDPNACRYQESNLYDACVNFQDTIKSHSDFKQAVKTTIHGVSNEIFIPTLGMVGTGSPASYKSDDGTQNYLDMANNTDRGCGNSFQVFAYFNYIYNQNYTNRICYDESGKAQTWWTATARGSAYPWYVNTVGGANVYVSPTITNGFRPFVALVKG